MKSNVVVIDPNSLSHNLPIARQSYEPNNLLSWPLKLRTLGNIIAFCELHLLGTESLYCQKYVGCTTPVLPNAC